MKRYVRRREMDVWSFVFRMQKYGGAKVESDRTLERSTKIFGQRITKHAANPGRTKWENS